MKKFTVPALLLAAGLALAGCSGNSTQDSKASNSAASSASAAQSTASNGDASAKSEGVMTYEDYINADLDSEVVLEAFVQDKQSWWDNKATIYAADPDGAYFIYNANVPEDLYEKLTPGTKIKVSGYKTEWSGETEVADGADVEVVDDGTTYIAPVVDVTEYLGNDDELIKHQNQKVAFNGLVIEPAADGSEEAYLYNYDGSGEDGDDLYFKASKDGKTYTFTVESYLTGKDSDVYKAVKDLKVGDKVDMEGFLYWYEGANPHITSVTVVE